MNINIPTFPTYSKIHFVKFMDVVKFNKIEVPKIKILKLTFGTDSNNSYYDELFTKIPNHSKR